MNDSTERREAATAVDPTDAPGGRVFHAPPILSRETAEQQARYVVLVTSNFLTTAITILASAFGLVAALAWNKAITDWLPTVHFLDFHNNQLARDFAYAIVVTLFAVTIVSVLGVINTRNNRREREQIERGEKAAPAEKRR